MVAGNMKIITLTNIATAKTQPHSNNNNKNGNNDKEENFSPKSKTNNTTQQTVLNSKYESPNMRYLNGSGGNNIQSLQSPKYGSGSSNNKVGKKHNSHMYHNIPTTSTLTRKKYYQHHRQSQKQHNQQNFSNNSRDIRINNNTAVKNQNILDCGTSSPVDKLLLSTQNQSSPSRVSGTNNVVDIVTNNTSIDVNTICLSTNQDVNYTGLIVDKSIALSSYRATTDYNEHSHLISPTPTVSIGRSIPLPSDTPTAPIVRSHNCHSENSNLNIDCNSCWAKLVTPQTSGSQTLVPWTWVHVSRRKTSSVSSTSSFSSSSSSSLSITGSGTSSCTGNNSELLDANATYSTNSCNNSKPTKQNSFRKGYNGSSKKGNTCTKRCSSPRAQGQRQRRTTIKYLTVDSTGKVSLTTGSQRNSKSAAEDITAKKLAMTTALAPKTVSVTAATTATNNSTATTTVTAITNSTVSATTSTKSTSNVVTLAPASSSSVSRIPAAPIRELAPPTASSATTISVSVSPNVSNPLLPSVDSSVVLSSASTTVSSGASPPNSYTLDFLHSVGVQMTGGANLSAISKPNMTNMRSPTAFSNHSTSMVSPARNACSYQSVGQQRPHAVHSRYMSSGVGLVNNSAPATRDQHGHRYQQHHHQPQQLTIASFMHKELLNDNFIGRSNSRGANNGNNGVNGSGNLGSVSIVGCASGSGGGGINNNGDYTNQQSYQNHQRFHSYYQPHYQQQTQQQQSTISQGYAAIQPSYHSGIGNDGASRIISNEGSNASNAHSHHSRQHMYQSYHDNSGTSSSSFQSHHIRNQNLLQDIEGGRESSGSVSGNANNHALTNNLQATKQLQQQLLGTKKANYASSSASSCSSSSSSSSSVSSTSSQASASYRQQKIKSTSEMNLVIETLPRKMNTSAHRMNHRLPQVHYYSQPSQHPQQYSTVTASSQATTAVPQPHQNIHNLTYVNTDGLTTLPNMGLGTTGPSRSCSPSLQPTSSGTPSPQLQDNSTSMILCYTPNHFQSHQQPNFIHSKRSFTPLSLNIASAHVVSTHTSSPLAVGNVICYSHLNDSTTSGDSAQPSSSLAVGINNDYDDSDSSSTHSAALSQRRHKYNQLKSVSLSSSSSASSTSSTAKRNFSTPQQAVAVVAVPQLHSPNSSDFAYNKTFAPPTQHYQPQASGGQQQQHIASPQQHQPTNYRSNGVISLLNIPLSNNFTDDDFNSVKQQPPGQHHTHHQQTQHFYFASGEHLNAASLPANVSNGGYWSPMHHSNFLYPQPANVLASATCSTPTATPSPRLSDRDDHHHHHHPHHLHNKQQQLSISSQNEGLPSGSHLKRSSTPQLSSAAATQLSHQHQRIPLSVSSQVSGGTATTTVITQRSRGGGGRNQQQGPQHHQQISAAPPPASISHVYPQHNLLYSSTQTHLRSSTSATHEFFTHTPPDRFLARAHLIESKEVPSSLLNNSKWDTLSQGVWNKFTSSQQTEETFKQKMRLWRYLYIIIKNTYPRFGLYLVGSTISGFGADTSDVDMCLVSRSTSSIEPRMEALFNLTVLRDYLSKSAEFENFNLIEAKVPILRFRDRIHQLEVDLNFNNCVGIKNTHLLYCYSQLDWRLRPMVLVTKLWAQYHNINNAKNMTISSYSLVLMVIHFLQYAVNPAVLPCLHDLFPEKFPLLRSNDFGYVDMNETIGPYESKNTQTIGELFLYFLEYYSCFDYTQFAISIRTGGILPINVCRLAKSLKNDIHQWKELCIEEPFDLTNTARSVYDFETFERVKAVFVASWRILQQTLDLNSIFAPIITTSNSVTSPLRHTVVEYDGPDGQAPSNVRRENSSAHKYSSVSTTLLAQANNIDSGISSNASPSVSSLPLSQEVKTHIERDVTYNTANENRKTGGGSLTALLS